MKLAALLLLLCACVSLTALAVGWMVRQSSVVLVPKETPPMFPACQVDTTGAPRLVWYQVRLDR